MRAITLRVAGSTMERVWSAFERTSNAFDGVLAACKLTPKPSRMIDLILAFMSPTISTVGQTLLCPPNYEPIPVVRRSRAEARGSYLSGSVLLAQPGCPQLHTISAVFAS